MLITLIFRLIIGTLIFHHPGANGSATEISHINYRIVSLATENSGDISEDHDYSIEQFTEAAKNKDVLIVDARPYLFFKKGHVPGATSLPWSEFENKYSSVKASMESQKDRTIIVYCSNRSCEDSESVRNALKEKGYSHVYRFRPGWAGWLGAKLPVEKSQTEDK